MIKKTSRENWEWGEPGDSARGKGNCYNSKMGETLTMKD